MLLTYPGSYQNVNIYLKIFSGQSLEQLKLGIKIVPLIEKQMPLYVSQFWWC